MSTHITKTLFVCFFFTPFLSILKPAECINRSQETPGIRKAFPRLPYPVDQTDFSMCEGCKDVPDLDLTKLIGIWYARLTDDIKSYNHIRCQVTQLFIKSPTKIGIMHFIADQLDYDHELTITPNGRSTTDRNTRTTFLATDYKSYLILHYCFLDYISMNISESTFIFTKERNGNTSEALKEFYEVTGKQIKFDPLSDDCHVHPEPPYGSEYPNFEPMKSVDIRSLSGTWFPMAASHSASKRDCSNLTVEATRTGNATIILQMELKTQIRASFEKQENGVYILSSPMFGRKRLTILETDYDQILLVHFKHNDSASFIIYARDKTIDVWFWIHRLEAHAKQSIHLVPIRQINCPKKSMPDPIEVRADGKAYVIPGLSSSSAAFDTSSSYILQETTSRMSYPVDQADFSKCPKYAEKQGLDMTKFAGIWYVRYTDDVFTFKDHTCDILKLTIKSKSKLAFIVYKANELNYENEIELKVNGRTSTDRNNHHTFLATDYSSYALVHVCYFDFKTLTLKDATFILLRDERGDPSIALKEYSKMIPKGKKIQELSYDCRARPEPAVETQCADLKPLKDLDTKKLVGTWFPMASSRLASYRDCSNLTFSDTTSDRANITIKYKTGSQIHGTFNALPNGQLSPLWTKDMDRKFVILETDYDQILMIHSCKPDDPFNAFLIYARDKTIDVWFWKKRLEAHAGKEIYLVPIRQINCPKSASPDPFQISNY